MKVRDLERLLIENGVGAAKIDVVTRRLREVGRLPKGGRGANAPEIGAPEAAAILLALAGSNKGVEADTRLEKLEQLPATEGSGELKLLEAVTELLEDAEQLARVSFIRVGRTARHAHFVLSDGQSIEFRSPDRKPRPDRFYVEGVVPAGLLKRIADAINQSPMRWERKDAAASLGERLPEAADE